MPFPVFLWSNAKGEMALVGLIERRKSLRTGVCLKSSGQILLMTSISTDPAIMNKLEEFDKPQKIEFCVLIWAAEFL